MRKIFLLILIYLSAFSLLLAQQKMTVKGNISDEAGNPLIGANIIIPSLTIGTTSDVDGNYLIDIPESYLNGDEVTIEVSYIGYKKGSTSFILKTGVLELNFTLKEDIFKSEEVVVTGIASKTSKAIAEVSVSRINADELTAKQPYQSLSQLVTGKISGVQVTPSSGNVGSGFRFYVRGGGGLNGDEQPIIYVDGIRIDNSGIEGFGVGGQDISALANLNPEDIESIEVLKGPAGAAEYGTNGSNGVVLITTKTSKFKPGAEARGFNVNYKYEYGSNVQSYEYSKDDYLSYKDANRLFRDGLIRHHSLGISGGIPTVRYYANIDNRSEDGILRNNTLDRTSLRLNLDILPTDKLNFTFRSGYVDNFISRPNNDNNIYGYLGNTLLFPTSYLFTDSAAIEAIRNEMKIHQFLGSFGFGYTPLRNLEINGSIGLDYSDARNDQYLPFNHSYSGVIDGERDIWNRRNLQYSADFNVKYRYEVISRLNATTTVGLQLFERTLTTNWLQVEEFNTELITNIGAGATVINKDESKTQLKSAGIFGTQYFSYFDTYFLTLSIRNDYASSVGVDAPNILYPKASFAVRLDKLTDLSSIFNLLKLRFSYGENGVLPGTLDAIPLLWGAQAGGYGAGAVLSQIGNSELEPERIKEFELGVDFEIFKNYSVEFTYYNSNAKNSIVGFENSPSTGKTITDVPFNIGAMKSYGFETLIQASPIHTSNFNLDMNLILNFQKNEVTDLGGAQPIYDGFDLNVIKEGLAKHEYYTYKVIGANFNPDGVYIGPKLSDERYSYGNPYPNFTGSFSLNFNLFKDFNVYVLTDWATGYQIFNNTKLFAVRFGNNPEVQNIKEQMAVYEDASDVGNQEYINLANKLAHLDWKADANFIEDADFFKIREISISYNFTNLLSSFNMGDHLQNITLGFSARNIYTSTKYSGADIEVNFDGSRSNSRGQDFLTLQNPKTYYFWVKLGL